MIKVLPKIYPDESAYSYLSRCFAHSGYQFHIGYAREVLNRPEEYMDHSLINPLNKGFKSLIDQQIGFEELVMNHTLFKYHARFLPQDKRRIALEHMLNNDNNMVRYLPIPLKKQVNYLKYCPICVMNDRYKYGESYFHVVHGIPNIHVCPEHKCGLIETNIEMTKLKDNIFIPLEQLVDSLRIVEYEDSDINYKVSKYIYDLNKEPFDVDSNVLVGDYLASKLDDQYISLRGRQRLLELLEPDIKEYFKDLQDFDLTKSRIAWIYRNEYINAYDLVLVSMFQKIAVSNLANMKDYSGLIINDVDQKICELYDSGLNYKEIAK